MIRHNMVRAAILMMVLMISLPIVFAKISYLEIGGISPVIHGGNISDLSATMDGNLNTYGVGSGFGIGYGSFNDSWPTPSNLNYPSNSSYYSYVSISVVPGYCVIPDLPRIWVNKSIPTSCLFINNVTKKSEFKIFLESKGAVAGFVVGQCFNNTGNGESLEFPGDSWSANCGKIYEYKVFFNINATSRPDSSDSNVLTQVVTVISVVIVGGIVVAGVLTWVGVSLPVTATIAGATIVILGVMYAMRYTDRALRGFLKGNWTE